MLLRRYYACFFRWIKSQQGVIGKTNNRIFAKQNSRSVPTWPKGVLAARSGPLVRIPIGHIENLQSPLRFARRQITSDRVARLDWLNVAGCGASTSSDYPSIQCFCMIGIQKSQPSYRPGVNRGHGWSGYLDWWLVASEEKVRILLRWRWSIGARFAAARDAKAGPMISPAWTRHINRKTDYALSPKNEELPCECWTATRSESSNERCSRCMTELTKVSKRSRGSYSSSRSLISASPCGKCEMESEPCVEWRTSV